MVKVHRFNKLNVESIQLSVSNSKLMSNIVDTENTNNYFFVPIYSHNKDILIQTTKIFIPFGLKSYSQNNKYSLSISINQNNLLTFIKDVDKTLRKQLFYKNQYIANYKSSIIDGNNMYPPLLNLKIPTIDNIPYINIFNHNKENLTYKHIIPGSYGICIIQPSGLWFKLDENYDIYNCKCIWNLLQIKLYLPFYMTSNVSAKCYIEDSDDEDEEIIVNDIDLKQLDNNNKIKKTIDCSCLN